MVNGVSSYNNYMNYLQTQAARSRPDRAEMFNRIDTDGSGGISQSELDAFVQDLSSKTGKSIDATNAISTYDTDGNGELRKDELKSFMDANGITPPPHGGHHGKMHGIESSAESSNTSADSIISAYDLNGDGVLSSDELQGYLDDNASSSSSFASLIQQAISAYGANSAGNSIFSMDGSLLNFGNMDDYSPVDLTV